MADQWEENMSIIYITGTEDQLLFSNGPIHKESEFETRLSRRTYIAFARWLKKNIRVEDLKSEIVICGFLNRYEHDLRKDRAQWLQLIQSTKDEDLYRVLALERKNHRPGRKPTDQDQDYLFEIPVYYEEDFYQLLRLYGFSEKKAAEFTDIAVNKNYKNYCRQHAAKDQLITVSEDLHHFAVMASGLPSRNWIRCMFKHEWPLFKEYQEQNRLNKDGETKSIRGGNDGSKHYD